MTILPARETVHVYQIQAHYSGDYSFLVGDLGSGGTNNSLSGSVTTQVNGVGVGGVEITATGSVGQDVYIGNAVTDQSGFYKIEKIPNRAGVTLNVSAALQNHSFETNASEVNIEENKQEYTVNFRDLTDYDLILSDSIAIPVGVIATPDPILQNVSIRWNINSTNFSGFKVYRDLEEIADISGQHNRVIIDSSGFAGFDYSYLVEAYWIVQGGTVKSEKVGVTATYPAVPPVEKLQATQLEEEDMIRLTWSHPTESHDFYEVKRDDDIIGLVNTGQVLQFEDTAGIPNRRHVYSVAAVKNSPVGPLTSIPVSTQNVLSPGICNNWVANYLVLPKTGE